MPQGCQLDALPFLTQKLVLILVGTADTTLELVHVLRTSQTIGLNVKDELSRLLVRAP